MPARQKCGFLLPEDVKCFWRRMNLDYQKYEISLLLKLLICIYEKCFESQAYRNRVQVQVVRTKNLELEF